MTNQQLCREALRHLDLARSYVLRDLDDQITIDAIALRSAAMVDVLKRLPGHVRDECFGQSWFDIRGMGNRIGHGCMTVDPDAISAMVPEDLPAALQHWLRENPEATSQS